MPIRGPATVIARTMKTLMTPPRSCHFGPATASPTPASERRATRSTESAITTPTTAAVVDRLQAPDAIAEPALNRDLDGSAEARREGESGGEPRSSSCARTLYAPASPTKESE